MSAELREDLLALDDGRPREQLPERWRAASDVLDVWHHQRHGYAAWPNGLGRLLAMLERAGYAVMPVEHDEPPVPVVTEDEVAMLSAVLDVEGADR